MEESPHFREQKTAGRDSTTHLSMEVGVVRRLGILNVLILNCVSRVGVSLLFNDYHGF